MNSATRNILRVGIIAALGLGSYYLLKPKENNSQPSLPVPVHIEETNKMPLLQDNLGEVRKEGKKRGYEMLFEQRTTNDAQFASQVLPVVRNFFSRLNNLGVSPLEGDILSHKIEKIGFTGTKVGTNCTFIIDDKWVMNYKQICETSTTYPYEGISTFHLRTEQNPHAWTSSKERLQNLSVENPINMTEETVGRIVQPVLSIFDDPSRYHPPALVYQKQYGTYDLNSWMAIYRKVGSEPLNQLGNQVLIGIEPKSPTKATLNMYKNTGTWIK